MIRFDPFQTKRINTISTSITSQEKSSPLAAKGRVSIPSSETENYIFRTNSQGKFQMEFSTTNQATTEVFRQDSGESTFDTLMKNELFRKWHKLGFSILVIAAFAIGCIVPLWYSGNGWISNKSLHPTNFVNPGLQFGSSTVYAEKGETITAVSYTHLRAHETLR